MSRHGTVCVVTGTPLQKKPCFRQEWVYYWYFISLYNIICRFHVLLEVNESITVLRQRILWSLGEKIRI